MEEGTAHTEPPAPSIADLAPLFPAYEIQQFIAEGGMGAVYLARQKSLDRPVAIKILSRELSEDPVFRASFEAEAKAMARLNHSNLIGVYDFGEADGMLFIVMEMVNGKSLHESAYGRTIDPVQAGGLVAAISRGLAHAHSAGILHRDIKPGNILLDQDANPKIGDFGLAQPMDQKTGADEQIYGTPGYTAPEVYQRKGDHRSDIFSVGIVLHELLTGKLPDGSGTPLSMLCGCSRAFDQIFARATNPNPLLRYESANQLADDLDKAVLEVDAANASTNRLVLPSAPPVGTALRKSVSRARAQAQAQTQARVGQSKSPIFAIVAVCLLIGIGLVAMLAGSGGKGDGEKKAKKVQRVEQANREANDKREKDRNARKDKKRPKNGNADLGSANTPGSEPDKGSGPDQPARPSPLQALAGLKDKLASGARDAFPPGTAARAGSHFLVVDKPMDWWEAKSFAEAHGAHLAILPDDASRNWFRENFPGDAPVWIGGGRAGDEQWQWLDGTKWNSVGAPASAPSNLRSLALGKAAGLQAEPSADRFHIALQWRDDASNPATTGAQLKRASETVKSRGVDFAVYPVGTRSYPVTNSHFFLVPKADSWDGARELADAAGGYLAVPSSKAESDWLRESFGGSGEQHLLWLGGYRLKSGEPWRWLTREAWNYEGGWVGGSKPIGNSPGRLLLQLGDDGAGWLSSDGAKGAANGMLIEWSPPKAAATIANFDLDSWLEKTHATFSDRVQTSIDAYRKDHGLLIDRYVRNMKRLGRKYESALAGQDGREKDRIREAVQDAVREVEKNQALLAEIPKSAPDEFFELQEKTENDLKELVAEFDKNLRNEVNTYTSGVTKQITELSKNGFDQPAAALQRHLEMLNGDSAAFLELLSLENPTAGAIMTEEEKKALEEE